MCTSKNELNSACQPIANKNDLPLVLTASDISRIFGIGKNTAYDLIRSGALKSVCAGRQIRVSESAFLEFLG